MVTLVVFENENKNIGARPLMLPLQADICTATQKININEWLQLPWQFIGFKFFLLEEELVSKEVL